MINFNASTTPIAKITYEYPQNEFSRQILDITPNPVITVTYADGKKNVFDTNLIFNRGYELGLAKAEKESKPKPFDVYDMPGYHEMLEANGLKVLAWETFGSYQGDYAVIVKKDGLLGFVVIGYGSCSGCDSLEACDTQEDYDSLMSSVLKSISWGGADFIRAKIANLFDDNSWYRHDAGFVDSIAKLLKAVK